VQLIIGKEFLVGGANVDKDLLQAQHWLQRAVAQQHTSAWVDDVFLETEVEAKSLDTISIGHSVSREGIPAAFSRQVWRKRVRKGALWDECAALGEEETPCSCLCRDSEAVLAAKTLSQDGKEGGEEDGDEERGGS
jgi:TPR repeat protein